MENIKTTILSKSGIKITRIGVGLWAIGGGFWGANDDNEAVKMIHKATEEGILFYDTADVYGDGHSEELLGKAMKGKRDKFVIATKIGWIGFDGGKNTTKYNTVDKLVSDFEQSLKRLQTDYVDILQRHIPFSEPTYEIFLEAFKKLKQEGKIRAYGVSTSDFNHLKDFNADGECDTLQVDYSILNRTAENDIIPYCKKNNIGVIIRGSLAMGILTGKFNKDIKFKEGDFRNNWINNPDENKIFLNDLDKVEKLKVLVNENRSMAQLALQFVLSNDSVSTVIPGARNMNQLSGNLKANNLPQLDNNEIKLIDEITPPCGGRKIWPA